MINSLRKVLDDIVYLVRTARAVDSYRNNLLRSPFPVPIYGGEVAGNKFLIAHVLLIHVLDSKENVVIYQPLNRIRLIIIPFYS